MPLGVGYPLILHWIIAHLALISLSSVLAMASVVLKLFVWWKRKAILECARYLRDRTTQVKAFSGNPDPTFPKSWLMRQLGKKRWLIDEVLELMESKGWAIRCADFHWKIR